MRNAAETGKRVPTSTRGKTPEQLKVMAERLKTSQARALQLAIHVMSRLTARIEQGATVVVRDPAGKETVMWLPELESPETPVTPDHDPANAS